MQRLMVSKRLLVNSIPGLAESIDAKIYFTKHCIICQYKKFFFYGIFGNFVTTQQGKHIIAMREMFFVYKHTAANTNNKPHPQKNGILKG